MNYFLFNLFLLILLINGLVSLKTKSNRTQLNNEINNSTEFVKINETPNAKKERFFYTLTNLVEDSIITLFMNCFSHKCGIFRTKSFWYSSDCLAQNRDQFYNLFKQLFHENLRAKKIDDKQTKILESICEDYLMGCGRLSCPVIMRSIFRIDDECFARKKQDLRFHFRRYITAYEA